jgi:hypothetical protein
MKSIFALALLLGLLVGCQPHASSDAPRSALPPPPMADYPPGSLGWRRQIDEAPITSLAKVAAAASSA